MKLALTLCLALLTCPAWADPIITDPAPALELPDVDGHTHTLPRDRVVIVDFFATWCGPCHEALERLEPLTRELGDSVQLIVVDVGEPPATVRRFFAARPPSPALVLIDRDAAASQRWGQHRFPTTFLIDRTGIIRFINRGYGPGYGDRITTRIRALLH
jgi:thiol-disulfide isomerase/thioredoxin